MLFTRKLWNGRISSSVRVMRILPKRYSHSLNKKGLDRSWGTTKLLWVYCPGDADSISLLQKVRSGMGSPDWNVSMVDIHLRKLPCMYCSENAGVEEVTEHLVTGFNDWADTGGQRNHHKWLASREPWNAEELETQPVGTKPRTSHHRWPGGERCGKRKC